MDVVSKITDIIEPSLTSMGYSVVLIKLADGARRKALMVMAERSDDAPMGFDDCTDISRTIAALLEVDDPITDAYDLEVCSPGMDRPLTKLVDYTRFKGEEVKLETMLPMNGRKRFRGVISAVKDKLIALSMPEGEVEIPFSHIRSAKLVPAFEEKKLPGKKPNKGAKS